MVTGEPSPGQIQAARFAFFSLIIRWTACLAALSAVFLFEAFTAMLSMILVFITYFAAAMSLSNYQIAPIGELEVAKKRLTRDLVHLSGSHLVFLAVRWTFFRTDVMGHPVSEAEFVVASIVDTGSAISLLAFAIFFNRT